MLLTHLSEVIRNNLAQLLSYKDMRALLDRLEPEYKRLIDDICPSQISYSGLQAVLKLLLAERVSIRNLHLILEAIAEIVPHVRRSEQVAEHVRMRMAQQICGDLADNGALKVLRLGNRWDLAFHQSLKRDAKGEVAEFDIDPRMVEQFGTEASDGHPRAHGPGPQLRADRRARGAPLCAHDHRAHVRDPAGAVASRDRARPRDQAARHAFLERSRPSDYVLAAFVVFSRIGACLMLMPGFSSPRIPVQVRLFIALALSLALTPLQADDVAPARRRARRSRLLRLMVSELLIGATIGLLGRFFFIALETIGMAISMAIGLTSNIGAPVDEDEPLPAVATLLTLGRHGPAVHHRPAFRDLQGACGLLYGAAARATGSRRASP